MPDQPVPPLDALQAQLRGAIDQQLAALKQHYEQEIASARREAAADTDRQIAARLESARAEWNRKLETDVASARKEGERSGLETAIAQAREQIEQTVAQARQQIEKVTAQKQQEIDQAVAAANVQKQQEIDQALAAAKAQKQQEIDQAIAAANAQKQQEVDQALAAANAQKQQEIDRAIAAANAQKQQEIDQAIAAANAHKQQEIDQAVAAAKAQAQQHADEVAAAKRTAVSQLESERKRAQSELEAERTRLQQQIDEARQRADQDAAARKQLAAELEAAKIAQARAADTAGAPAATTGPSADRIVTALQNIDSGASLSQVLDALLRHVSSASGRAAIFSIDGDRLKAWKSAEIPDVDVQSVDSSIQGRDLLARAIQSGQLTRSSAAVAAPPFARLAPDRDAAAVPLLVGGRPVAVVYADNAGAAPRPFDAWAPAIDVFARHASAVLAVITATRTLELLGGGNGAAHEDGEDQAARRYARLLISEIKLYNEGAVRVGRQQRDLLHRLQSEIDRARRMYEERIPSGVGARAVYFQQELVQTLADGDPSALGNP